MLCKTIVLLCVSLMATRTNAFRGGRNTVPGEFPSIVSIQTPAVRLSHCNGVILNDNHIITAAQCVFNTSNHLLHPFWLRVTAGDLNIMVPSYGRFTTDVTHIYPHPSYNPQTRANDIAILRVRTHFPFPHNTIDMALQNERVLPNGASCEVAGWGATQPTTAEPNELIIPLQQTITLPILDRAVCNTINLHSGGVLESMLCAGILTASQTGICAGTLGAPLFHSNRLAGILSFGLGCGAVNHPPVFTQVRFFRIWIERAFTRTDIIPAGTSIGNIP